MTVTDDVGEQCVADVLYTVGLPPSIVLNEPVIGSLYNEGESILFVVEVSDSEDAPGDLNIGRNPLVDGLFSNQGAASTGLAQFTTSALTFGVHDITGHSDRFIGFVRGGIDTSDREWCTIATCRIHFSESGVQCRCVACKCYRCNGSRGLTGNVYI